MAEAPDEYRRYAVAAVAQKGARVGFRMVLATARSKEEAISVALAAFEAATPGWIFSAPDALVIPDSGLSEPALPPHTGATP